MQTRQLNGTLVSAVGFAVLLATGCSPESTGTGLVTVRLSAARADATASTAVATQDVTTAGAVLTDVSALTVTLSSVQLQTSGSDGWQPVASTQTLDLLNLPDPTNAVDIGEGEVVPGLCQIRLFVSDVSLTFNDNTYTMSNGELRIPSGDQTGLKADGTCAVTDVGGANHVTLAFDVGATVGTIVMAGNGQILLTPVIHVVQQP